MCRTDLQSSSTAHVWLPAVFLAVMLILGSLRTDLRRSPTAHVGLPGGVVCLAVVVDVYRHLRDARLLPVHQPKHGEEWGASKFEAGKRNVAYPQLLNAILIFSMSNRNILTKLKNIPPNF
jgi:hypothetical protein